MTPRVLIVAGSDSGGGAGIQADIRTVTMLGGHPMTAITTITAQNTLGVQAVMPIPVEMVVAQMRAVIDDIGVDAVKIGMIGSAETAQAVADVLETLVDTIPHVTPASSRAAAATGGERGSETPDHVRGDGGRWVRRSIPIVFDPVMVATSGSILADADTVAAFARLMRLATVITPNLPELAALGGENVVLQTGSALLVKGGHADDANTVTDRLVDARGEVARWTASRIATRHTHGTGCTLASGIAEGLARGLPLPSAIARARTFVRVALHEAPGFGAGHGPMGHQRVRVDLPNGPTPIQVTLPATDHAESLAFYRALGLVPIVDAEGRYARFESAGGATLSIEAAAEIGGRPRVYLEVPDVDAAVAAARTHGIAVDDAIDQPWGWREARLVDPAGNPLCLCTAGENRRFPPWRLPCPD